jgi:hypothetical protein
MSHHVKIIPFELNGDIFSSQKFKPIRERLKRKYKKDLFVGLLH